MVLSSIPRLNDIGSLASIWGLVLDLAPDSWISASIVAPLVVGLLLVFL